MIGFGWVKSKLGRLGNRSVFLIGLLFFVYVGLWWAPVSLVLRFIDSSFDAPRTIDGPISWYWGDYWGNTASIIHFQIWVPFGAFLVYLSSRPAIRDSLQDWGRRREHGLKHGRQRDFRYVVIASVLLVFSHLIHLMFLAVFALILMAYGYLYAFVGANLNRSIVKVFAVWCLMIPIVPESLLGAISIKYNEAFVRTAFYIVSKVKSGVELGQLALIVNTTPLPVGEFIGGISSLTFSCFLMLIYGIVKNKKTLEIVLLSLSSIFCCLVVLIFRVLVMAFLVKSYPQVYSYVARVDSLLISTVVCVTGVWFYERMLSRVIARLLEASAVSAASLRRRNNANMAVVDKSLSGVATMLLFAGKAVLFTVKPLVWVVQMILDAVGAGARSASKGYSRMETTVVKKIRRRRK